MSAARITAPAWLRRGLGPAILAALALWAAAGPGTASGQVDGARFVYESCDPALPGANPPVFSSTHVDAPFTPVQDCGPGNGWLGLYESAAAATGDWAALEVAVPPTPGGFVESETVTAIAALPEANAGSHVLAEGFPGPNYENVRTFPIRSTPAPSPSGDAGNFQIVLDCNTTCSPAASVGVRDIAATEVDVSAPRLGAVTGSLLAGGVVRGHQTLEASASDEGGGLTSLAVLVNGTAAAPAKSGACALANVSNASVVGTVALSPSPCPGSLAASWTLDTAAAPFHQGTNSVSVCATDLATLGSANTSCSAPATVEVDDSCTESPVANGQSIEADFVRSGGEKITVARGKGAQITGTLVGGGGVPIGGATICLKSATLGSGQAAQPVGWVRTDPSGHFSYALPAGPDREVIVGYRHDSFEVDLPLRYLAHAGPSLKANPRRLRDGGRVRLHGRLPGPAAGGRVVVLQAGVVGSRRWITFRRSTTDRHGRFAARYRFHSTTRKTRYRFRAVVPRQRDYPYLEGHSRPVSVLVRPRRPRRRHR